LSLKQGFNILQQNYTSEQWALATVWDSFFTCRCAPVQSGLKLVCLTKCSSGCSHQTGRQRCCSKPYKSLPNF